MIAIVELLSHLVENAITAMTYAYGFVAFTVGGVGSIVGIIATFSPVLAFGCIVGCFALIVRFVLTILGAVF